MSVLFAVSAAVLFFILLKKFGLVAKSKHVVALTQDSIAIIGSTALQDEEKEDLLQANALTILKLAFIISLGGAGALMIPLFAIQLGELVGIVSLESVIEVSLSWPFLIVITLVPVLALPWRRTTSGLPRSTYSSADQALHRLAFNTRSPQLALSEWEDRLFSKQLETIKIERPVFIAGLPRAGTTLLLEICANLPEFAAHLYRDMPFVLTPLLWNRFTAKFRKTTELRERAHGDGMLINEDSPEALEEILWTSFWHEHYLENRILTWRADEVRANFHRFFTQHLRKIMLLRTTPGMNHARYISKNNLNIARLELLRRLFPDAVILVPFRDPFQHATSLLRQHENFLKLHSEDAFAADYMREVGHFDFGINLKPVDFNSWFAHRASQEPKTLAFWIEYWVAAYQCLLSEESTAGLTFVDYDALCEDPQSGLTRLANVLDMRDRETFLTSAARFQKKDARAGDVDSAIGALLEQATRVHSALRERARIEA